MFKIQNNYALGHNFLFLSFIILSFEFVSTHFIRSGEIRISDLPIGFRQVKLLKTSAPFPTVRDCLIKKMGSLYIL